MGLETFEYITSLNRNNPAGADQQAQGDDHIRGVKQSVQDSFPNIDGPVLATPAELNLLVGLTSIAPIGTVIMYAGDAVPNGYLYCNGDVIAVEHTDLIALVGPNTPDFRGQFLRGASDTNAVDPDGPRLVLDSQAGAVGPHTHPVSAYDSTNPGANPRAATNSGFEGDFNTKANTGAETRPVNVSVRFCIKY